jgi:hypothetical protein
MMTVFPLALAGVIAFVVLCAAWLTRTAQAPTWAKVCAWSLGLISALYIPLAANAVAGRPVETTFGALPRCFDLAAFFAHDGEPGSHEARVELWLVEDGVPRSYGVIIPSEAYGGLQDARAALEQAPYVRLCKEAAKEGSGQGQGQPEGGAGAGRGDRLDGTSASGGFAIDPAWFDHRRKDDRS